MNKKVLKETKRAYCDSTMGWVKSSQLRNLNFRASAPVSVNDAVEIMTKALGLKSETQEGYNNFAPALLRRLPKGTKVTLAREGSVCVYAKAKAPKAITQQDADEMLADEYHTEENGTVRLWWD